MGKLSLFWNIQRKAITGIVWIFEASQVIRDQEPSIRDDMKSLWQCPNICQRDSDDITLRSVVT
jgi:hypothetical protein